MTGNYAQIARNALWERNPGTVQLLGLCPLLAMTTSVVSGVSLGIATTLIMATSSCFAAWLSSRLALEMRIPAFMLLIVVLVTLVQLTMQAYLHPLYVMLGIFVPLIAANCLVLARAEIFAANSRPLAATVDGAVMGIGLTLVLAVLGALRELLGQGTYFPGSKAVWRSGESPGTACGNGRFRLLARPLAARGIHAAGRLDRGQELARLSAARSRNSTAKRARSWMNSAKRREISLAFVPPTRIRKPSSYIARRSNC